MGAHRASRALYRGMLRLYPTDFRQRFADDLDRDFADLLAQRGVIAAWRRVVSDLFRSLTDTHAHAHGERRRLPIPSPGERPMSSLMFDVRHALRALARAPVFTGVTILTLALGIGANSAIFSLVNAVLIRPVGYQQPDRLMMIYEASPRRTSHASASHHRTSSISPSTNSRSPRSAPIVIAHSSFRAPANPRR